MGVATAMAIRYPDTTHASSSTPCRSDAICGSDTEIIVWSRAPNKIASIRATIMDRISAWLNDDEGEGSAADDMALTSGGLGADPSCNTHISQRNVVNDDT